MPTTQTNQVVVVVGPGSIGQAIARRVSAGKQVLLADVRAENAETAANVLLDAGFDAHAAVVDISSRESIKKLIARAAELGELVHLIHAAGVSPSQAAPETILKVDLYGTAVLLEEVREVIAPGGSGVVIASQSAPATGTCWRTRPWGGLARRMRWESWVRICWARRVRSSPAVISWPTEA